MWRREIVFSFHCDRDDLFDARRRIKYKNFEGILQVVFQVTDGYVFSNRRTVQYNGRSCDPIDAARETIQAFIDNRISFHRKESSTVIPPIDESEMRYVVNLDSLSEVMRDTIMKFMVNHRPEYIFDQRQIK